MAERLLALECSSQSPSSVDDCKRQLEIARKRLAAAHAARGRPSRIISAYSGFIDTFLECVWGDIVDAGTDQSAISLIAVGG